MASHNELDKVAGLSNASYSDVSSLSDLSQPSDVSDDLRDITSLLEKRSPSLEPSSTNEKPDIKEKARSETSFSQSQHSDTTAPHGKAEMLASGLPRAILSSKNTPNIPPLDPPDEQQERVKTLDGSKLHVPRLDLEHDASAKMTSSLDGAVKQQLSTTCGQTVENTYKGTATISSTSHETGREKDQRLQQQNPSHNGLRNTCSYPVSLTDMSEPTLPRSASSSQATTPVGSGDSFRTTTRSATDAPVPHAVATAFHQRLGSQALQIKDTWNKKSKTSQQHSASALPLKHAGSGRNLYGVRPKASIPLDLSMHEYAGQCIAAAEASRLNPYALHEEEYAILREHISHPQVTTYLNIRNGILRLWLRNPRNSITKKDAIGCAKETRWFNMASFCFDWLVRRGYINYGCTEIREAYTDRAFSELLQHPDGDSSLVVPKKRKRIVVIGAGMSGLGCARQLDNLFKQYGDRFHEMGEEVPEVVVLEGRQRIGGRVYSRAFEIQPQHRHPEFMQSRCTAEMGGMIVTGFDRGNPMNTLIRGQLGLGYHALLSTTTIYDTDGKPVDSVRDGMVENLFNECLDRVSEYKFKLPLSKSVEGSREHVNWCRDSPVEGHGTIASIEDAAAARATADNSMRTAKPIPYTADDDTPQPISNTDTTPQAGLVPVSLDRLTGRAHLELGMHATQKAAHKLKIMGWELKPGVTESQDLNLDPIAKDTGATFGQVMEEAIAQYCELVDLNSQDFRLLNWHIANLEYSNAINHNCLSLLAWDIDAGNEWEGKHSMIIGGYQSVPHGLMLCPTPLDVRTTMAIKKITYSEVSNGGSVNEYAGLESAKSPASIECENGHIFEADYVISTLPLGVLKYGNVEFSPPLPPWKSEAIERLGYGVLNKIILTYRQPFWNCDRDIFGVLREPENRFILNQKEYSRRRGRMFQWFNASKTTGMPCLVALMAGDAAFDTEQASNDELVAEATSVLRSIFGVQNVPDPIEVMVTRWASDKFARGSYSSAGPGMKIDDYDVVARPVGRCLHFAGEHTTGTHPATVHGAYLSGIRAASDVLDDLLGPLEVPMPLVIPKETGSSAAKRKYAGDEEDDKGGNESSGSGSISTSRSERAGGHREALVTSRQQTEADELRAQEHIHSKIGTRPVQPPRMGDTAYLLFSKANYDQARQKCEERRRPGKGRPLPNEVRVLTSKMWRSASAEERRPYVEDATAQKQRYDIAMKEFKEKAAEWDISAGKIRAAYEALHPKIGEMADNMQQGQPSAARTSSTAAPGIRESPSGSRQLRRMASHQAGSSGNSDMP